MQTIARSIRRAGALVLAVALAALGLSASGQASAAPPASPPTLNCATSGTTRTCDLYATTGTITLPGNIPVSIWGYSASGTAGSATLPGPTIDVPVGTSLQVNLHNMLTVASSLHFDAQGLATDKIGAASGATKLYTFSASKPGTFLYEAGLTATGNRQVAMGMFGALVVRPAAAGQAYAAAASAYDDEAVLVLSEIDPALNVNPTSFDMRLYAPKYWLVNGAAFPSTTNIDTAAGRKVLLRYLNAGIRDHGVGLLGMHQNVIATDGHALAYPYQVVAETVPAGTTLDTIATVPTGAPTGAKFAIYNAAMHLDNAGAAVGYNTLIDFGGMLTFLNVTAGTTTGDTAGPLTSGVTLTPSATNGTVDVALNANISDNSTGGSTVAAAEYFIDTVGANGTGTAISGTFGSPTVGVNATLSVAALTALSSGNHTVYVHGQDALGNWGQPVSAVLNLDKTGPKTTGIVLTPSVSQGTLAVSIQATGDDSTTGNSNVTAASYSLDGGAAVAMSLNLQAPVVSLSATIPAPLGPGVHTVAVTSQDAGGNVGAATLAYFTVDTSAPTTSNVVASPNPNNGAQSSPSSGVSSAPSLRVDALFADATSANGSYSIAAAEGFIDSIGTTGNGFAFQANDGVFNSAAEAGYGLVPLTTINLLSNGPHPIYVHAKDAAGNWNSVFTSGQLIIDRAAPVLTAASVAPTASPGVGSVTLTTTANDPVTGGSPATGIAAVEWFEGADPGVGNGTITFATPPYVTASTLNTPINVSALASGAHTLSVRVRDAAGNWSNLRTVTLTIDRLFASAFNGSTNSPFGWSSATGAQQQRLVVVAAANLDSTGNGLQVTLNGNNAHYLVNNLPPAGPNNANVTSYHARFYVNPNGANIGTATPTIFAAMSGGNRTTTVFQVQMRLNAGQYQVRAANANASASTTWVNISGTTAIEVARNSTTLTLYDGGVSQGTVTVANTNLTAARLGMSAGLANGMSGTVYFDGFVSTRNLLIGP